MSLSCNAATCTVAQVLTIPRKEATLAAAVEAMFASINPNVSKAEDLSTKILLLLDTVKEAKSFAAAVQRSLYKSITDMLQRLEKEGENGALSASSIQKLKVLLFGPEAGSEALRMLRADAVFAMVKCSPALASQLHPDILTLVNEEPSTLVRDRLTNAIALLAPKSG